MSPSATPRMRKGTKSCTECRRRKLRCSWGTENSVRCRRCEERKLECLAQTSNVLKTSKLNSKDRITRLETKIDELSRALSTVQSRITHLPQSTSSIDHISIQDMPGPGEPLDTDQSDTEDISEHDEIVLQDGQDGIQGLFRNEWLEKADPTSPQSVRSRRLDDSQDSDLAHARSELQKLIPEREDVLVLSDHVAGWARFVSALFPSVSTAPTQDQLISSYSQMKSPNVDVWALGNWLLALALSAQQVPQESNSPGELVQSLRKRYSFANTVADTVESTILVHDRLLGTVEGLEMCPNFLRVMLTRGRIQRAWLTLRRLIAVAEFMGLPQLLRSCVALKNRGETPEPQKQRSAQLWISICVIDRVCSTLNGLPVGTRSYSLPESLMPRTSMEMQPIDFFMRLSNIAMRVQDLEESTMQNTQSYNVVLTIDRDLQNLATTMPQSWYAKTGTEVTRSDLLNFMLKAVTLQLHIRYVLREAAVLGEYAYSRTVGLSTCLTLTQQWCELRNALPFGFFLFAIMDVQAFTAIVTMMLVSTVRDSGTSAFSHVDRGLLTAQIHETTRLFEAKSRQPLSSKFLEKAVVTLQNLRDVLEGRAHIGDVNGQSIVLKVPLLGKVHVKRHGQSSAMYGATDSVSTHNGVSAAVDANTFEAATRPETYEALTWAIEEDGDTLLPGYLMMNDNDDWMRDGYFANS